MTGLAVLRQRFSNTFGLPHFFGSQVWRFENDSLGRFFYPGLTT